jgi:hypothetical protein
MKNRTISRRELLRRSAAYGAAGLGLVVFGSACGGEEGGDGADCTDTSSLTPTQRSTRSSLQYVDQSPHGAEKNCANCSFYTAAAQNETCGGCTLVPGPIAPEAYCASWAPKS